MLRGQAAKEFHHSPARDVAAGPVFGSLVVHRARGRANSGVRLVRSGAPGDFPIEDAVFLDCLPPGWCKELMDDLLNPLVTRKTG